jgi:hypothetical protein
VNRANGERDYDGKIAIARAGFVFSLSLLG